MEEKLKELIISKYGSLRHFSEKIGLAHTTVDSILKRGAANSNITNVLKICNELHISAEELANNNRIVDVLDLDNKVYINDSRITKIPVLGTIKAGIPIESQEDIIDYIDIPIEWTKGGKRFYGLKISGNSMYPKYSSDDIVVFEQNDDLTLYNGKDCAIMINGTESTFKKLIVNDNGVILQAYNMDFQPMIYTKEQVENLPIKVVGIAREKRTIIE